MKKTKKPKKNIVKELANEFDKELNAKLPLTVLPNGSVAYKNFLVKSIPNGNWGMFNIQNKELIEQFFLKSCAIMAAQAYDKTHIEKFFEIKRLDNRYWASHCDTKIYQHNIKKTKEFERYLILLNKLEQSNAQEAFYKEEISRMFRWAFV